MEKQKTNLSDLKPVDPNGPVPFALNPCERIKNNVNIILLDRCSKKVNRLRKCTKCEIKYKNWPVINSPMDANLLNTAYDGANGKLDPTNLNNGQTDLHWEVGIGTNSGPASVAIWIPAFVSKCLSTNTWVDSPSNANWISYYKDSVHSSDNLELYFCYSFYLNTAIDPSQFSLDMDFYADNSVHEIYINNIPQSYHLPQKLPQTQSNEYEHIGYKGDVTKVTLANDWKPCENKIVVHVKSNPGFVGFLAQFAINRCYEAKFPTLTPTINISWGDSNCDCIETDDTEIMCITVCNGYSNAIFKNFVISKITVVDENGGSVPILPDGTPSVGLHPIGPYCFGDIAACSPDGNNCVSREFVLINRGAKAGKYKILIEGICFEVCNRYSLNDCFEYNACYS